jgi:hypothetical protein
MSTTGPHSPFGALRRLTPVLALLVAAGCTGGSGSAPPAPSGLSIEADPVDFDRVLVHWSTSTPVDSFEAQGRLADGAWQDIPATIPGAAIGAAVQLAPATPELVQLAFRLRSVRGGSRSEWSAPASTARGLRWPSGLAATPQRNGMLLGWMSRSSAATGIRVSRQVSGTWRVLAELPPTAESFLDTQPMVADQPILYRVRTTAGAVESLGPDLPSSGFPPTAVWDLAATSEAGGVRLRWSIPPISDQGFAVCRCDLHAALCCTGTSPHPLPADTTSYLDAAVPPGAYRYEVQAAYSNPTSAWTSRTVEAVARPTGPLTLEPSLVRLPYQAQGIDRSSTGLYAVAVGGSHYPPYTGPTVLRFSGQAAPPEHDFGATHGWASPAVLFDEGDRPHVVVLVPTGEDPPVSIRHAWHDGTSWQEETIARRAIDDPLTVFFARAPGGLLAAAWSVRTTGVVEVALRGPGGWSVEDLAPTFATLGAPLALGGLAFDAGSTPAALVCGPNGCAIARRNLAWTREDLPTAFLATLHPTSNGIAVVQSRCVGPPPDTHGAVVLLERSGVAWSGEQVLDDLAQCLPMDFQGFSGSADGGRSAAWAGPIRRLLLHFREADGPWGSIVTGLGAAPHVWFDATGRAEILVPAGSNPYPDDTELYVRYVEP